MLPLPSLNVSYFQLWLHKHKHIDLPFCPVFAPIGLIMKYETVEQAIEIANGTRYGLGASVFGPVKDDCLKVAKRLQCGMVAINDFGVFYVSTTTLNLDSGDRLTDVSDTAQVRIAYAHH